jgi:hypothetical protein
MSTEHANMLVIKNQIQTGEYRVDTYQVADAIIRRMVMGLCPAPSWLLDGPQKQCSNPASSSSASTNATPGDPSTTDPIQVSPTFAPRHC